MSEVYSIGVGKYSKYFLIHQTFDSKLSFLLFIREKLIHLRGNYNPNRVGVFRFGNFVHIITAFWGI